MVASKGLRRDFGFRAKPDKGRTERDFRERDLRDWKRIVFVGLSSFILFSILTVLVVSGIVQSVDFQGAILVNMADLGQTGTWIMVFFTNYGREVVWSFLVLVMFLFGGKSTKLLAIELTILLVAGIVVGDAAKILIQRPRPPLGQIVLRGVPREFDFSYPSGHALIVSIGAAFCIARFRRKTIAGLLAVEAGIVCYSRVYVGLHYPLDVIGGVLLGTAIALVGGGLLEKYFGRYLEAWTGFAVRRLGTGPLDL